MSRRSDALAAARSGVAAAIGLVEERVEQRHGSPCVTARYHWNMAHTARLRIGYWWHMLFHRRFRAKCEAAGFAGKICKGGSSSG